MLALNQIVAQNSVLGESVSHGGMERTHIVNSFACETRLPMQILIDIGNGGGIGIKTRLVR